jgi:hypothetical protein
MKNETKVRRNIILIIIAAAVLLITLSIILLMNGKEISTGRCVVANNGKILWIDAGGSPVELIDRTWFGLPENLKTGDEIWLIHADAIAESYPGQVGTYFCIKTDSGSISDICDDTIASLTELGWLNSDESVSNVGGVEAPSNVTNNVEILISSDEYYEFLTTTAENAVKDTIFKKYNIGVSEYPYFDIVFILADNIDDDTFYETADNIAREIYNELISVEYQSPPIYKYSYNNVSIEFYTEAHRNIGANCCYQLVVDDLDKTKGFDENVTLLTQQD